MTPRRPQRPIQGLNYVSPLEAIATNNSQVFFHKLGAVCLEPTTMEKNNQDAARADGATPTSKKTRHRPVPHHSWNLSQPIRISNLPSSQPNPKAIAATNYRGGLQGWTPECEPIQPADRVPAQPTEEYWTVNPDPMTQDWLLDPEFFDAFVSLNINRLKDIISSCNVNFQFGN